MHIQFLQWEESSHLDPTLPRLGPRQIVASRKIMRHPFFVQSCRYLSNKASMPWRCPVRKLLHRRANQPTRAISQRQQACLARILSFISMGMAGW